MQYVQIRLSSFKQAMPEATKQFLASVQPKFKGIICSFFGVPFFYKFGPRKQKTGTPKKHITQSIAINCNEYSSYCGNIDSLSLHIPLVKTEPSSGRFPTVFVTVVEGDSAQVVSTNLGSSVAKLMFENDCKRNPWVLPWICVSNGQSSRVKRCFSVWRCDFGCRRAPAPKLLQPSVSAGIPLSNWDEQRKFHCFPSGLFLVNAVDCFRLSAHSVHRILVCLFLSLALD